MMGIRTLLAALLAAGEAACSPYLHSPPVPLLDGQKDGPRTAIMLAYRFVFASHEEYIGNDLYQERWHDFYHLGVVSFDFVLRKRQPKPGEKRGRYKIH